LGVSIMGMLQKTGEPQFALAFDVRALGGIFACQYRGIALVGAELVGALCRRRRAEWGSLNVRKSRSLGIGSSPLRRRCWQTLSSRSRKGLLSI
jgi:hypothetical protein